MAQVPSLPTRNGNIRVRACTSRVLAVPSLPTRNGNGISRFPHLTIRERSQPTYKEWKHQWG